MQAPMRSPFGDDAAGCHVFFNTPGRELRERFNELILIQGGRIIDAVKTYRGDGFSFL
jgi:hypothetical protein